LGWLRRYVCGQPMAYLPAHDPDRMSGLPKEIIPPDVRHGTA
jgi:hypothetical protein